MKGIKITSELKSKNELFKNREGFYIGSIPNKFHGTERIVGGYAGRTDLHSVDGWKEVVQPTYNTETHKLGTPIEEGNVITYTVLAKTPEELEAEKFQKLQIEKEKIKEAKVKAYVKSVLTPAERLAYYPEWKQQAYAIDAIVTFKGKVFKNTVEVNTNAPDKGGWIEIK